jgi:serine/threonine-protein kinase
MGEVYVAHDDRLRRDVAIKLIAPKLDQETEAVDRFIREALAVSTLNHPNIVTIHEAGEAPEGRYLVMELVQGRTLREVIRQGVTVERPATWRARLPRPWRRRMRGRSSTAT